MKELKIHIKVGSDKIASGIKTEGFDSQNISHQLELLGILENTKVIIQNRINLLLDIKK